MRVTLDEDHETQNMSRKGKKPKHSKNIRGVGMRVINNVVEDAFDEYDDTFYIQQSYGDIHGYTNIT